MHPHSASRGNPAQQSVTREQDARIYRCGNQTEAVVRGQARMTSLHHERLTDFLLRQIMRDHAGLVERLPFGLRKVEHFGGPHRPRDHESIG